MATLKEMCAEHGIVYQTVIGRLGRGWALERALTEPVAKQRGRRAAPDPESISSICKAHGISRSTYNNRIKRGMSHHEALTAPVYVPPEEVQEPFYLPKMIVGWQPWGAA